MHRRRKITSFLVLILVNVGIAQEIKPFETSLAIDHVFNPSGDIGGGCVFFDYDNDGWEDVYLTSGKSRDKLFRNLGNGSFKEVLSNGLEITEHFYTTAAVSGDINNDGFRDLFVTTWKGKNNSGDLARNLLFINNGNGTFTESGLVAGFNETSYSTGAAMFDYNNDGLLDVYVVNYIKKFHIQNNAQNGSIIFAHECFENIFYENKGDGTFVEKSKSLGIDDPGCGLAVMPTDVDQDYDTDLYIANDFGADLVKNGFYQNNFPSPNFTTISSSSQADIGVFAMGIASGDFDKDGDFDYYITNIGRNVLLQNNGATIFTDIATSAGVENTNALDNNQTSLSTGWGTAFLDVDNDSWPDLFVANGKVPGSLPNGELDPNKLFLNNHDGTFTDVSTTAAINDTQRGRGMAYCDLDKDGDLDILVVVQDRNGEIASKSTLYINQLNPTGTDDKNWVQFKLSGESINKDAIGAKVILTVNGQRIIQEIHGQGSHASQHSLVAHFGLAANAVVDQVEIIWSETSTQTFSTVEANHRYLLKEGGSLQIDSATIVSGCTDPNSCNYDPLATVDDGSCQYLSANEIQGATLSGFNQLEQYTYTSTSPDSNLLWTVEGGHLLEGQGTPSIKVKWDINEMGNISVRETNSSCNSDLITLDVALSINQVSENISVARIWNEALLEAIRRDFARPNVHARNLFHTTIALYDAWAIYDDTARPYLMGNTVHNFKSKLKSFTPNEEVKTSREKAMSFAAYRVLKHRFMHSPGHEDSLERFDLIMDQLGYDKENTSVNYESGDAAALGNYIGQTIIDYGLQDGSREQADYDYAYYEPINEPLNLNQPGIDTSIDPNRWQPLQFETFIDQSGNLIPGSTPKFLGPEWGNVKPFALSKAQESVFKRDGNTFNVYHDPGTPPQLSLTSNNDFSDAYKWNFSLVAEWSSHLDASDGVLWDISPRSIGNVDIDLMTNVYTEFPKFYKEFEGGDIGKGHALNPATNQPYEPQIVPRGDYTRVLAEFWADGPDSETPPGHWFTILNYVSDHPLFKKQFNGEGPILDPLEWDIKCYFILAGAMHDTAISAWGIKGWYDYIRPISALRYMSKLGQSTDENLPNYNVAGIPLKPGFIELVTEGDPLRGLINENVGKIKVRSWKGHNFINNAATDVAGVDWILAENWWPYQRPSFVTPPFAGYVSGHSAYSRAAAEVLTLVTGDEYFPGGMGEFVAKKNEFLVFEKGPSVDVVLQWATYRDASDQTSLSRIWGGIHPPADDIPGRLIGMQIGHDAYNFAIPYFTSKTTQTENEILIYPNPVVNHEVFIKNTAPDAKFGLFDMIGRAIDIDTQTYEADGQTTVLTLPNSVTPGLYLLKANKVAKIIVIAD